MKEKYEHEIRELENGEKSFKDKYIDARTRLAESDANNQNLKAMVTQFELQLSHSTKVNVCRCASRTLFENFSLQLYILYVFLQYYTFYAMIFFIIFSFKSRKCTSNKQHKTTRKLN